MRSSPGLIKLASGRQRSYRLFSCGERQETNVQGGRQATNWNHAVGKSGKGYHHLGYVLLVVGPRSLPRLSNSREYTWYWWSINWTPTYSFAEGNTSFPQLECLCLQGSPCFFPPVIPHPSLGGSHSLLRLRWPLACWLYNLSFQSTSLICASDSQIFLSHGYFHTATPQLSSSMCPNWACHLEASHHKDRVGAQTLTRMPTF